MFSLPSDVAAHLQRGGTVLVPTRPRQRAVQLAHAAAELGAGRLVWASADALTPSAWARRECERRAEESPEDWPRVLGPAEEWLLWREAAQRAARQYPFLNTGLLAESLQRASERAAEYGITVKPGAHDSEALLLFEAQRGFEARCQELKAASVSALMPRLARHPARGLLLRGFDVVPPRLAALAPQPAAQSASAAQRPAATTRAVRTADAPAQMEAIAAWCRERLEARPDARLLVILPGPAGARARLAALIRDALDPQAMLAPERASRALVGIEGGEPFGALALPSQALLTLEVLLGSVVTVDLIARWLTSSYWSTPDAVPRAHLALLLRERGPSTLRLREFLGALQLAPRELKPAARELDTRLRQAERKLGDGRASPRRWSERFEAALAALGWPGPVPAQSAVHQMRLRWRELLEEFGELALSVPTLDPAGALELLRALAMHTSFRPLDEGAPVTLSPLLADPVVIYDGIWVGSLAAGELPQPPAPDPFLPLSAQLAAGVPEVSIAGRRAQADALLAAWRRSAPELVLSVPARDDDREQLPSPYLADLAFVEEAPAASLWLPLRLHREGSIERFTDVRGTTFNPLTPLPGGTRALTLQNTCAFRAYAELRLGAVPVEQVEPGVPMDQRGLLLHAALQMLWEELRNSHALAALDAGALEVLITQCVAQAARTLQADTGRRRRSRRAPDTQFDLFAVLSPALERECARATGLIQRLCALERQRPDFTVEATEHMTELALGGGRVRLRLDRIDRIAGGRAVLDYKSGRPGSPDWYGERPTHPQLLAYLAALGGDVLALATVNLTAREVRFTGVAATGDLLPQVKALPVTAEAADWSAQRFRWQALIERLIRAFLTGDAQVDPAPGACDYCHLTDVCRIGAHLATPAASHADDTDE